MTRPLQRLAWPEVGPGDRSLLSSASAPLGSDHLLVAPPPGEGAEDRPAPYLGLGK
jgi:hypothetical protein